MPTVAGFGDALTDDRDRWRVNWLSRRRLDPLRELLAPDFRVVPDVDREGRMEEHLVDRAEPLVPRLQGEDLAAELKGLVKSRLGAHEYPREIDFVDELPMTPTGKIRRNVLRQSEAGEGAKR